MNIGGLRHRVALRSRTESRDESGGVSYSWATDDTVWGKIEPLRGRELFLAQQVNAEITMRITIRYYSGLSAEDRVLFGSRVFEILAVINPKEINERMELLCKEIA